MLTLKRLCLFSSRWLKARRYGLKYKGTSRTPFPDSLTISGLKIPLLPPAGNECIYDLFNVLLDDEYGLRSLATKPSIIVDIGVNIGIFSIAAREQFTEARIFGYEPSPSTFEQATHNLKSAKITLFNEAVGLNAGTCTLTESSQSRLARTVISSEGTISLIPFSEVLARAGGRIDLLKMDCEGAEWDILKDQDSMRHVRSIRMEYHLLGTRTLEDLRMLISCGNHKITKLVEERNHGIVWLETQNTG